MDFSPARGAADLLPPRSEAMRALARQAADLAERYGYRPVDTPAFEATELFSRTSGESSDVVRKEMYTFEDRGGRQLTLRPEATAGIMRAFLNNARDLPSPFKAYLLGPMWRYGRPQSGRMREFRQFDVEVIGAPEPGADVEVAAVGERFLRDAGLERFELQINSIGDENCRPAYRQELLAYLEANVDRLRDEHRDRFAENPLRVLDCKDESCRAVAEHAPRMLDRLCGPCREHFDAVLAGLREEGIEPVVVPTLVRGLDYYTRTAFEYVSSALSEGQASLGGAGRYDGLGEALGGRPTPGVGFALGLERILLALEREGAALPARGLDFFVVAVGEGARDPSRGVLRELRKQGWSADAPFAPRSLKGQLRMADRTGARYAVIVGEREIGAGTLRLRRLADGQERELRIDELHEAVAPARAEGGP